MTYAQAQEDDWLLQQFPEDFQGFALDIGAYDGVTRSNTLLLEQHRWTVLCIEANPQLKPFLTRNRPFVQMVACGSEPKDSAVLHIHMDNPEAHTALRPVYHQRWHPEKDAKWTRAEVKVKTPNQLLIQAEFPRLDVLSVDVEGNEADVLKGIDLVKWTPKALMIESWDAGANDEYLKAFGYKRVRRLFVNDAYLREEPDSGARPD